MTKKIEDGVPAMDTVVLDTSVLFKWFHHEREANLEEALVLRDAYANGSLAIVVPDLIVYEFTNAIRFKSSLSDEQSMVAVRSFWSTGLEIYPVDAGLSEASLRISYELNLSTYDAAFLALAKHLESPLITADTNLYQRARRQQPIILLEAIGKGSPPL